MKINQIKTICKDHFNLSIIIYKLFATICVELLFNCLYNIKSYSIRSITQ